MLIDIGKNKLIHSIGKNDIRRTVLTEKEFIIMWQKTPTSIGGG